MSSTVSNNTATTTTTTNNRPTSSAESTTKPAAAAKRIELHYNLLPNVNTARTYLSRLLEKKMKQIAQYAKHFDIEEPSLVEEARLRDQFRGFASMLLVHFARRVLGEEAARIGPWTALQAARVRAPFDLYGLLDGEEERERLDLRLEEGPDRLRAAILEGTPEFAYLNPSYADRFVNDSTDIIKAGMPDGLAQPENPLPALVTTLGSTCSAVHIRQRPETVQELRAEGVPCAATPSAVRCSFTGREMRDDDRVMRFRLVHNTGGGGSAASGGAEATAVFENVVDHALVRDRLRADAPPLPQYLSEVRVSGLLTEILNYSASYHWLIARYEEHIHQSCEYAVGNISSEVLEEQRQRNATKRQTASGGAAKNTVVLKVGTPGQIEQCFQAFELGTFTGHSIETLVDLFARYAKLQVQYLIACRCTSMIQSHNSTPLTKQLGGS